MSTLLSIVSLLAMIITITIVFWEDHGLQAQPVIIESTAVLTNQVDSQTTARMDSVSYAYIPDDVNLGNMNVRNDSFPGPDDPVATDVPPSLLSGPSPEYPSAALRKYAEGTVWVRVLIDSEGNVRKAFIEQSSGQGVGFEEAALKAAMQRKYDPARYEGRAVAVWSSYQVTFKLRRK